MRIRFWKAKKTAQPRNTDGTFGTSATAVPRQDIAKTIQGEQSAISGTVQVLKDVLSINEQLNGIAQDRAEALYEGEAETEISDGWADVAKMAIQVFGETAKPYIPSILERFGFTASQEAPSPSPQPPSPQQPEGAAQDQGLSIIKEAAQNSPGVIKTALKLRGYKELEKRGIDKDTYRKAILNLAKAEGFIKDDQELK